MVEIGQQIRDAVKVYMDFILGGNVPQSDSPSCQGSRPNTDDEDRQAGLADLAMLRCDFNNRFTQFEVEILEARERIVALAKDRERLNSRVTELEKLLQGVLGAEKLGTGAIAPSVSVVPGLIASHPGGVQPVQQAAPSSLQCPTRLSLAVSPPSLLQDQS